MNKETLKGALLVCICFAILGLGAITIKQNRKLAYLSRTVAMQRSQPQEAAKKPTGTPPSSPAQTQPVSAPQEPASADLKPAVAFIRPGLLTPQNKAILQKKLVEPITAFHNEKIKNVVALLITVPSTPTMDYTVVIITKDGGTEEFGFSLKGENTRWWLPTCMDADDCGFTTAFKTKYPEIVASIR
jgi:hypothetical protein